MRFLFLPFVAVLASLQVQARVLRNDGVSELQTRQSTTQPPTCALECLATLIPQYCNTLTNVTCICTDTNLATALTPCALASCSIPDAFLLQRYSAESCGVPNDKTRQTQQFHMYYVLPPLVFVFVAMRVFSRVKLEIGLGADDWMIVAATLAYFIDVGTGLGIVINGFGMHTYWLDPWHVSKSLQFFYISELFYILAITLTKLSLLLFFRRIFPDRRFKNSVWAVGGFVVVSNFAILMALTFQCVPFHGNWTNWMYKVAPVKCINSFVAIYVAAALSIFHDVVILLMPIPILWSLNLNWQKKIHLLLMFSVGSFVIVCSLCRLPTLMKMKDSMDPSYDQAPVAVWTNLEIAVGIICACLPACRSLVGFLFPGLKMSLRASTGKETPAYPDRKGSNLKMSRKRTDASMRSFIELNDRTSSSEDRSGGKTRSGRPSLNSHGSDVPITDGMNKEYGVQTVINVRDVDERSERNYTHKSDAIMMTRTVDQRLSDRGDI